VPSESSKITDKIRRLKSLGVDNNTISQIIGKPSNYVSAAGGRRKKAADSTSSARTPGRKSRH